MGFGIVSAPILAMKIYTVIISFIHLLLLISCKNTEDEIGLTSTGNHERRDAWSIILDKSGNIQWQKCLGGTGGDRASAIQQTNDGGYIVAGFTESNDGDVAAD